ncbi:PIG-L deacetylase family protein [Neptunicella marina]|uniref:PIG-L family deacetylase n=1 Tax=Neptunicella marina TaxID=2125989 RepID=A0A8J6ISG3_9ALTE|nr:PIG-L deacetylase family protein [Neptunicella marina]MBC3765574.1 PIG-L family deacetylase [Neptunicella marina]
MLSLLSTQSVKQLLCIGAHPDDIEIGAGCTIRQLIKQQPELHIHWVVLTGKGSAREQEAINGAERFTQGATKVTLEIMDFRDAYLPWQGEAVKAYFDELKQRVNPDLILTHCANDKHQDHQFINQLCWNSWRNNNIWEYEIVKWDGDLGQPQLLVPVSEEDASQKADDIYQTFVTQQSKSWFKPQTLLALMRIRGVECHSDCAEAFYVRKMVFNP